MMLVRGSRVGILQMDEIKGTSKPLGSASRASVNGSVSLPLSRDPQPAKCFGISTIRRSHHALEIISSAT